MLLARVTQSGLRMVGAKVGKSTLELFSGTARLTSAIQSCGMRTATPFDTCFGNCFDLTKRAVQRMILGWISMGLIWYIHLGTPCAMFSIAKKKTKHGMKMINFNEPCFAPFWLDEVREVTRCRVPAAIQLQPCPKRYSCPWKNAVSSWGTEAKRQEPSRQRQGEESD